MNQELSVYLICFLKFNIAVMPVHTHGMNPSITPITYCARSRPYFWSCTQNAVSLCSPFQMYKSISVSVNLLISPSHTIAKQFFYNMLNKFYSR